MHVLLLLILAVLDLVLAFNGPLGSLLLFTKDSKCKAVKKVAEGASGLFKFKQ
jgi:hypothetical protein